MYNVTLSELGFCIQSVIELFLFHHFINGEPAGLPVGSLVLFSRGGGHGYVYGLHWLRLWGVLRG